MSTLSSNLSDAFAAMGRDVALNGSNHFASRAEAEAANITAAVRVLVVTHNERICVYTRSTTSSALQTADGQLWGPADEAKFEHWGLSPTIIKDSDIDAANGIYEATYVVNQNWVDAGPIVQKAVNETYGTIRLHGWLRLDTHFDLPPGTAIIGDKGQKARGGFIVTNQFNTNPANTDIPYVCRVGLWRNFGEADQVSGGEPAGELHDLTFMFEQPTDAATRNDLYTYPWCIDMSGSNRASIDRVRITLGTDGVNLVDGTSLGNPGGVTIGELELACFNENIHVNGAYDYVVMDTVRVWPFGFAGLTDPVSADQRLFKLWEDGNTIGWRHGKVDGFHCNMLALWNAKAIMGSALLATHVNPGGEAELENVIALHFGAVYLDHVNSVIEFNGGKTWIDFMYNTCAGSSATGIRVTKGHHVINQIDARMSQTLPLHVTGGRLDINGGLLRDWSPVLSNGTRENGEGFLVEGGELHIRNTALWWSQHGTNGRSVPVITQRGGGILTVQNCRPRVPMQTVTNLIKIETENLYHNIDLTGFGQHTIDVLDGFNLGTYKDANKEHVHHTGDNATLRHRVANVNGEGFDFRFQRARGSIQAPADVGFNDNLGDISFDGWASGAYRNAGIIRAEVDGVTGSTVSGKLRFMMRTDAGTFSTALLVASDSVTVNEQLTVNEKILATSTITTTGGAFDISTPGTTYVRSRANNADIRVGATDGTGTLFYPIRIEGDTKKLQLGEDLNTPIEVVSPVSFDPAVAATDDLLLGMTAFRPHFYLQDKSSNANDVQWFLDAGTFEILVGDASTGTKLTKSAYSLNTGGSATAVSEFAHSFNGKVNLRAAGAEGGELVFKNSANADAYTIDVDGSGNLRIRQGGAVKITLGSSGGIQLPGALEGAGSPPAGTGVNDIWVDITDPVNSTLKRRRS